MDSIEKIDLAKSGTYKSGPWEYRLVVTYPGSKSEGRVGTLLHGGKALPAAKTNDYYVTPWGKIYHVGHRNMPFGDHGWIPRMKASAKIGKKLTPPAVQPVQPGVYLTGADNGKTRAIILQQQIILRLKANATTGYKWSLKAVSGDAVKAEGKVAHELSAAAGGHVMSGGGSAVLKLKAVKVGQSVVRLEYRRPSEKDKPAAKTFTVTLDVKARPAAVVAGEGVTGKVVKLKGNFMPGPGAAGGQRIPLSVPVHIFKGKVKPFKTPDRKHPQLVKVVQSAKDGSFKAALPPGVYTVVAEIKGKLHLNIYTVVRPEGMRWGTVTVEKDKWTPCNIDDASEAAY